MSAQVQARLTPEQYLQIERLSESRNEYYNGRMFAMSGGTYNHARLIAHMTGELYIALKKGGCDVASNDLRIRIAPGGLYTYPDIVVVCGGPEFADDQKDTLVNPALIIEILSPSTEAYDRGFKAVQYRKLTSLKEYALVSQTEARIEVFRRQPSGDWLLLEWAGMDATCHFASAACNIALADIYAGIVFAIEDQSSAHPSSSN